MTRDELQQALLTLVERSHDVAPDDVEAFLARGADAIAREASTMPEVQLRVQERMRDLREAIGQHMIASLAALSAQYTPDELQVLREQIQARLQALGDS